MSVFIKMLRFIGKNFDIGITDTFRGEKHRDVAICHTSCNYSDLRRVGTRRRSGWRHSYSVRRQRNQSKTRSHASRRISRALFAARTDLHTLSQIPRDVVRHGNIEEILSRHYHHHHHCILIRPPYITLRNYLITQLTTLPSERTVFRPSGAGAIFKHWPNSHPRSKGQENLLEILANRKTVIGPTRYKSSGCKNMRPKEGVWSDHIGTEKNE